MTQSERLDRDFRSLNTFEVDSYEAEVERREIEKIQKEVRKENRRAVGNKRLL